MIGVDDPVTPAALSDPAVIAPPARDPVSHLSEVYRDYPGLRALILRRVRDPELAADILQDAAVTTLEKLRNGEIAHPENVGGYLFRVAINHLRNYRRKDRAALSSADALDELRDGETDPEWERVGRPQWAAQVRALLDKMAAARDRELLIRFYLYDEEKEQICRELGLTQEHFNRVIFRARNRFRELLQRRGFLKRDLLGILALALTLACSGGHVSRVAPATVALTSVAAGTAG
jgi:RNA polymerase sigma-70 factor, ECF subfamily